MFSEEISTLCVNLGRQCEVNRIKIVTAESCTAGLLSAAITHIDGSSNWFERGYVTYSNAAKIDCLDINAEDIDAFGAVSSQIATQMALGALKKTSANLSIGITGIAGPTGGSKIKPVGTVYFAVARNGQIVFERKVLFEGDRGIIREHAVIFAINTLLKLTL